MHTKLQFSIELSEGRKQEVASLWDTTPERLTP